VLLVAISIIGGYAVLQFSDFAFFNQISNMVMATMTVSAFFALFFLRALMMIFKPRFVFGHARATQVGQPVPVPQGGGR
jgi:predicted RND superfamily exporter protein